MNICFDKVKSKDQESVSILKTRISESEIGIYVKNSVSLTITEVEVVKNKKCGLHILDINKNTSKINISYHNSENQTDK